jgi:hypothetical protein
MRWLRLYTQPQSPRTSADTVLRAVLRVRLEEGEFTMFAALRFIWNATSGHRFRPWRSEYLKWRIETYSGRNAEELRAADIFTFFWREKWNLLRYLRWTGEMESWKKLGEKREQGTGA